LGVFSVVCFALSVPVQVIVWKDSSPKWPIILCVERDVKLHSVTRSPIVRFQFSAVYNSAIIFKLRKTATYVRSPGRFWANSSKFALARRLYNVVARLHCQQCRRQLLLLWTFNTTATDERVQN